MGSVVHTRPHQGSPCSAGSISFDEVLDERDFDSLPSAISETQGIGDTLLTEPTIKKFSQPKNEISELALAEGFSWQPKKPVRPGQFSERPMQKASNAPIASLPSLHEARSLKNTQASPKAHPQQPKHNGGQLPLDLPELSFEKTPEPPSVLQQGLKRSVAPPEKVSLPQNMPGKQETPRQTTDTMSGSLFSGHQNLFPSSQGQNTHLSDSAGIKRTSFPFPDPDSLRSSHTLSSREMGRANGTTASPPKKTEVPPQIKLHEQRSMPGFSRRAIANQRPSHIRAMAPDVRHHSPASTCGDLEGPVHQTPRQSFRPHRDDLASANFQRWETRRQQGCSRNSTQRSQSRTSNISKKRAAVHKPFHGGDLGRKKALMEQVAIHWNECLQLAEEEKQGAVREISRLQDDVAQKSKELKDAQAMVSHRQRQVQKIEERCKNIEEQQSIVSQHNEQLSGEVESLRKELSESNKRAVHVGEKYKAYRDKINDAISEQQDLYKRSRAYYQHLLQELEQERTKQSDKAGEIDEALKVSQEKRSEMKRVFEELQTQMREESRKSKLRPLRLVHL